MADLSFPHGCDIKRSMERIEPQQDHKWLNAYLPGQQVRFQGKVYKIQRRTTLASGEAAVVLEGEKEQFVISAAKFLAGLT
jgi:predicted thioesterase